MPANFAPSIGQFLRENAVFVRLRAVLESSSIFSKIFLYFV
jgi:hypothetical protein